MLEHLLMMLVIIWVHTFADFVMQPRDIAQKKSSDNVALTKHIAIYSVFLLPFGLKFAIINAVLHWVTDYCSSRLTTYYYKKENMHAFFSVIGFDQAAHLTALIGTYYMFHVV